MRRERERSDGSAPRSRFVRRHPRHFWTHRRRCEIIEWSRTIELVRSSFTFGGLIDHSSPSLTSFLCSIYRLYVSIFLIVIVSIFRILLMVDTGTMSLWNGEAGSLQNIHLQGRFTKVPELTSRPRRVSSPSFDTVWHAVTARRHARRSTDRWSSHSFDDPAFPWDRRCGESIIFGTTFNTRADTCAARELDVFPRARARARAREKEEDIDKYG